MKNILLLNIELYLLASVRQALVLEGYNVIALPEGGLLTAYLGLQTPDLIVLPEYDKSVSHLLQQALHDREIPVIAMPFSIPLLLSNVGRLLQIEKMGPDAMIEWLGRNEYSRPGSLNNTL